MDLEIHGGGGGGKAVGVMTFHPSWWGGGSGGVMTFHPSWWGGGGGSGGDNDVPPLDSISIRYMPVPQFL